MKEKTYNRQGVLEYAQKWAYDRNPNYYNFDSVGGDCTSFASQCIYAGSGVMNYARLNGWFYINGNKKSPSWSGVEFLYEFLTTNKLSGPYGKEVNQDEIDIGDIAQLSFNGTNFGHTLVITKIENKLNLNRIFISSHTYDSFNKRISEYNFEKIRFIHINKVRI